MTKVLYVHSSLNLGGAQSVRYMFLKNLKSDTLDVTVCCLGKKGEFGERIEKLGYRVDVFNMPCGLLDFSTTVRLYHYIKKNNFDIVHSSLFYANYHSALAARLAKAHFLITEEHGEHKVHHKKRHLLYRYISRKVAEASDLIFCCSDYVKEGIRQAYKVEPEKAVVLKNLVDDKRLEIRRSRADVRKELNISEDAFVMVNISSLYWIKNQHILIDAVKKMVKKNVFLIMVGDGPLRDELKEMAGDKGVADRIRYLGWREDVAGILNASDVFVLPSLSEGLPICLLEAMSIGLPCIASRVGGIVEVLRDEITGLTIKPDNLNDLNHAVARLINDADLRQRLGLEARIYVKEHFQPSLYVDKVLNVYFNFLKNKKMEPL